jgi:thiamine-monophosphate kinase
MSRKIRDETEFIATYLAPLAGPGGLGLRDDAAVIAADGTHDLVVTTDPIVSGVHFFADDAPCDVAWKSLAVNVSDLIAKGADPVAYTLALGLPEAPTEAWISDFVVGLREAQSAFGCSLIGGDTDRTMGALSVSVTAFGRVPCGTMVKRTTARRGDHVYVSGTIGDAALGLLLRRDGLAFGISLPDDMRNFLLGRYLRPKPHPSLVPLVRSQASAALDISDGLVQDAGKLARAASSSLVLRFDEIPLSRSARKVLEIDPSWQRTILTGGDDYEVLFAVPPERSATLLAAASERNLRITHIGVLAAGEGVSVLGSDGQAMELLRGGYDHFAGPGGG